MDNSMNEFNYNENLPSEEEIEEDAERRSMYTFGIYKIARVEDKKFWMMAIVFGLISYVFSIMKDLKDTFVIVRQIPASIHFLKLFYIPPIAILGTILIQKALVDSDNKSILMRMLLGFAVFYFLFAMVSLPLPFPVEINTDGLKDTFADGKMKYKGTESILALLLTFYSWTSTVLFISSEIFGTLVLSLLFLSFANDICPINEFLRFLPLLYTISNLSLILSSISLYHISNFLNTFSYRNGRVMFSCLFIILSGLCLVAYFCTVILDRSVLSKPIFIVDGPQKKKSKQKISFNEGFKLMFTSKLVLSICLIVLFYNISQNMVDSSYKSLLRVEAERLGKNESFVINNQWRSQMTTGIGSIILLITPFSKIVRTAGWIVAGMITPIYVGVGCSFVFILAVYNTSILGKNGIEYLNGFVQANRIIHSILNSDDAFLTFKYEVIIGRYISAGFKIIKYASFDICKEAISMKINPNCRSRFKGVYDGICSKLGKSMGAMLSILMTMVFSTTDVREASIFYFLFSTVIVLVWVFVVIYLGKKYNDSVTNNSYIDIDLFQKTA
ncbi:ADP/ATP carrier protein [Spraguea lophii 42_110]|uniref:ADP,ATP carrier protein n=1 Tax=Spraguea lophii (strain 42_110) TaxID=1358809 RepID=S7XKW6_SPRLO|nr:ADP/ATP carrier protein [Spraguea lophii 42_110]